VNFSATRFVPGLWAALMLVALAACDAVAPPAFSSDIDDLLARGDAFARMLVQPGGAEHTEEEVVALGYLERARLGIGSPFRLVSYVRRDERLSPEARERLAYALLSQTLRGRGYEVDPAVLEVLELRGAYRSRGVGENHLALIERAIAESPSASSGERAVRLGYMLASMERSIEGSPDPVVGYIAAMVADRRRAGEDAVALLRAAAQLGDDPLELLETWRRELRFRVEAPAMSAVLPSEEMAEATRGAQLAAQLRDLGFRLSAPAAHPADPQIVRLWQWSWLSPSAAARLAEIAHGHDYPAQAPIAVAVGINREALVNRVGLSPEQKERRAAFTDAAINEEKLAAASVTLSRSEAGRGPRLALIVLQAGVFMRGWNQEEPWFPGDAAPTARDLENRFGLGSVTFGADVPEAWRPYYRRMLGRALTDLHRVLPTASLRGLNIRFAQTPADAAALALHEPRTRTLILPPHTGAGTIAHEVAHDLDWQLARKRYNRRGSYASDLAVNRQKGDRVAASLVGLAASFARDGGAATDHDRRPAEVFARGVDWLVAAHLAAEGRSGGYLTSFQDATVAGYGTTRGPHVDGAAVPALLTILEQIAPPTPETRQWASDAYGPTRSLTAKELVRAISAGSVTGPPFTRFAALETARDRARDGLSAASCHMTPSYEARRLLATRRAVIQSAVRSAARGIVIEGVHEAAADLPEPPPAAMVDEFIAWRLDGGPEPADSAVHLLLPATDELVLRSARLLDGEAPSNGGFQFDPELALCGGNPFAAERDQPAALFPSIKAAWPGSVRRAPGPPPASPPPSAGPALEFHPLFLDG
jgi:hypothetical protein